MNSHELAYALLAQNPAPVVTFELHEVTGIHISKVEFKNKFGVIQPSQPVIQLVAERKL